MLRGWIYRARQGQDAGRPSSIGKRSAPLKRAVDGCIERLETRLFLSAVRLAVISDYGVDLQSEADVANLVKSWDMSANPLSAILTTGDNDQNVGNDYDRRVGKYFHEYIYGYNGAYGAGSATQRFLPSPGNHDWGTGNLDAYLNFFTMPASSSGNERYYSYQVGPVEVFMLDSDTHEPDGTSSTSQQAQWLQQAMQASTASWQLVFFHHGPYSSSSAHYSSTWMRWPMQEWGADAVFSGHNHVYERVNVNGLRYFTVGLGGQTINSFGTLVAGSEVRYNADHGAMLMNATETQLSMQFINRQGAVIDTYSMTNVPMPTVSVAATDSAANEGTQDGATFTISRTTILSGDLTVNYTLGGTAINGGDYQPLSGSVVIPDGQASVVVNIAPIQDALGEGDETIALSLSSDPGYMLGASSATATLVDDDAQTATFRQGVDTYVHSYNPNSSYAGATSLNVDTDDPVGSGGYQQTLIRFSDLVGPNAGQIPAGSTIISAKLELNVTNTGNTVNVHRMLRAWTDGDTWNSLGNGVQVDGSEALASIDGSFTPSAVSAYSLDMTSPLQAWLANPAGNYGWVLSPTGTDGVDIDSFEGSVKPKLVVTYAIASTPIARGDSYSVGEDAVLSVMAPGVLGNDSVPPGGALSAVLASPPANGTVVLNADGSFTYTPCANFTGTDSFAYVASDGSATSDPATVTITVEPAAWLDYAAGETIVYGNVTSGDYMFTNTGDDVYEAIREVLWNNNRKTRLEHRWQFNVAGGAAVTFYLDAYRSGGVDSFAFQYSTDGATWTPMVVVSKTADDDQYQTFEMPAGLRGAVQVRAIDTDSANSEKGQETLYVDEMFFRSVTGATSLPTVTIAASDPAADEAGDPGQFVVTRTGDTSAPLRVVLNITGSADPGLDYEAIATEVTIPAGQASAVFSVAPIQDTIAEGEETVVVALASNPAYTVGAASSGVVTIVDDEPIPVLPAAPSNLAGTALSTTQIQLTWTDNASDEVGFYIEYATSAGFTNAARVAVGADVTSQSLGGLMANTLYYVRICAFNAAGESVWSNVVQVRTKRK